MQSKIICPVHLILCLMGTLGAAEQSSGAFSGRMAFAYATLQKIIDDYKPSVDLHTIGGRSALHLLPLRSGLLSNNKDENRAICRFLLSKKVDVNKKESLGKNKNFTALHALAASPFLEGVIEIIEMIVAAGVSLEERDDDGKTPLHYAAKAGAVLNVKKLVELGADLHARTYDNRTLLHEAVSGSFGSEMASYLLGLGLPVDKQNNEGKTALHIAMIRGNAAAIVPLLQAGASTSILDNEGNTPVHYLMEEKSCETLQEVLFRRQIDINLRNMKNFSLVDVFISSRWAPEKLDPGAKIFMKMFARYCLVKTLLTKDVELIASGKKVSLRLPKEVGSLIAAYASLEYRPSGPAVCSIS